MKNATIVSPERVFALFRDICAVPRGSGNRKGIADHVQAFAEQHGLRCVHDAAHNVIVYKNGSAGREDEAPVILQGHLDMVCQKDADCDIDFERDGIEVYVDGEELRARGTTLGADNGIAAAMMLAVLEDTALSHPPIEAVFTADEEIGMLGAWDLDMSLLRGRRMLNLDAEEDDTLTVSCAGGSDLVINVDTVREDVVGTTVTVTINGLKGGHSGVEIDKNRANADKMMGRLLMATLPDGARLIALNGGDKGNAIPLACEASVCVPDAEAFATDATRWLMSEKEAFAEGEPHMAYAVAVGDTGTVPALSLVDTRRVVSILGTVPDGVVQMSAEIEGLVETSLNLGVLTTETDRVVMHHTLRSNKQVGLDLLEKTIVNAVAHTADAVETFGHYPPWEFKADSPLQQCFMDCYQAQYGKAPKVEAIHAGLECAVFASRIPGLDCIAFGPSMRDVHTTSEALNIRSAEQTFTLLVTILQTL